MVAANNFRYGHFGSMFTPYPYSFSQEQPLPSLFLSPFYRDDSNHYPHYSPPPNCHHQQPLNQTPTQHRPLLNNHLTRPVNQHPCQPPPNFYYAPFDYHYQQSALPPSYLNPPDPPPPPYLYSNHFIQPTNTPTTYSPPFTLDFQTQQPYNNYSFPNPQLPYNHPQPLSLPPYHQLPHTTLQPPYPDQQKESIQQQHFSPLLHADCSIKVQEEGIEKMVKEIVEEHFEVDYRHVLEHMNGNNDANIANGGIIETPGTLTEDLVQVVVKRVLPPEGFARNVTWDHTQVVEYGTFCSETKTEGYSKPNVDRRHVSQTWCSSRKENGSANGFTSQSMSDSSNMLEVENCNFDDRGSKMHKEEAYKTPVDGRQVGDDNPQGNQYIKEEKSDPQNAEIGMHEVQCSKPTLDACDTQLTGVADNGFAPSFLKHDHHFTERLNSEVGLSVAISSGASTGKILQLSMYSYGSECEIAGSLDTEGLLLFWLLSNGIMGLQPLNSSCKFCEKNASQESHPHYGSLSWSSTMINEYKILLMGHVRGIDCFIVKICESESNEILCHNLCTISFPNSRDGQEPTSVCSDPSTSNFNKNPLSDDFIFLTIWKSDLQALSWKVVIRHYGLPEGTSKCSFDIRNTVDTVFTFESNLSGKRYFVFVDPCSSVLPDPHNFEEVVEGIRRGDNEECSICQESADDPVLTPYAHRKCRECLLSSWRNLVAGLCPICRQVLKKIDLITCPSENKFRIDVEKINRKESSKFSKLLDCLEGKRKRGYGEKNIVFSRWTSFLDLLEIPLKRRRIQFLRFDGRLSQKNRESILKEFNETKAKTCEDAANSEGHMDNDMCRLTLFTPTVVHVSRPKEVEKNILIFDPGGATLDGMANL